MSQAISATSPYAQSPYGTDPSAVQGAVMTAASSVLGIDQQTLQSDLKSGQSLADIASSKGIASSTLVSAIAQSLQASGSSGSATTASQATTLATDIVNRKGGGHHHHHHGGSSTTSTDPASSSATSSSSTSSPFSTVASMLGMSQDDLLSSLEQGTSLSSLLSQSGVTVSGLSAALGQGSVIDTTA